MRELLVIIPSRGRPGRLAETLTGCTDYTGTITDIAVGLDSDDPRLPEYWDAITRIKGIDIEVTVGERDTLTGWTNKLARKSLGFYRYFASLGDDHVPMGPWDYLLTGAIDAMGGDGIAYGDDRIHGASLPTAPVISHDIVQALGWMCQPTMQHYCVDNVWKDLGEAAGCLAYVPEVVIEHRHPVKGYPVDQTYEDAGGFSTDHPDWLAYQHWREHDMATDAETIRKLRS